MSIQFSVTRVSENYFRIVVQDEKIILTTYDCDDDGILNALMLEIKRLEYGHLKK